MHVSEAPEIEVSKQNIKTLEETKQALEQHKEGMIKYMTRIQPLLEDED